LQEERDRTRAILDSAGEGIIFTDSEGVILYANPAMSNQTGYNHSELVGHTPDILNSGLTPSKLFEELWQTIRSGQRWRGEVTNRRKDGSLYTASITITPLYDQQHELKGFVSIQSDITQLKELDRLKSEFVTNVSHELRTPLTNIRTFVTLLKMGKPEKLDHYRQVLERETDRLTRLIQDLLDLSRIETNMIKTNLHPEDITTLLDDLVQSFTFKAQEKQIELNNNWPDSLPLVLMDKDQITQVLTNLLGNALAYTPAHGRIILHAAVRGYHGQEMMAVMVQDTGMGLDEEDKRRLFERFYRGHAATESRAPGTGLGLAISKEIMTRHQGEIEVESEVGRGTTFTIWLPVNPEL
jgi:two-component system phosphate regulon sensor histidine kinase PhoR